jgi:hypothetical protein
MVQLKRYNGGNRMFKPATFDEFLNAVSKMPKQEELQDKFMQVFTIGDVTQMVSKLVHNGVAAEEAYAKARKHYYNMSPEHAKFIELLETTIEDE